MSTLTGPEHYRAEANAEAVAFCSQHCTPVIGEHVGDTVIAHDMACPHYNYPDGSRS